MALETLADVEKIGEVDIHRVTWNQPGDHFIEICDEANAITFKLQNGPIRESGVNGCQIDDMLNVVRQIISKLNSNFPCRENSCAITKLDEAMMWLKKRTADREFRGVEGTNQV